MPATARSSRYRERSETPGSPKRSESSTATGRAPIAKMSRRIPPTPVAAPWNGSTALGWLCDSTLNAHASPPPTSTAPAFSPGPINTWRPSVGSVRSSFFECLYAQCSLQSSENIASSTWFGGRSSLSQISSYSARVSPRASASSTPGRTPASGGDAPIDRLGHRREQLQPVGRGAGQLVDRVLGVRHEPEDVARLVADAGDVGRRAVRVGAVGIAQDDLAGSLHPVELPGRQVVAPGRVLDRDRQPLALSARAREGRVGVDDLERGLRAAEAQVVVAEQRAGQQPRLAQHLEAVADPEHEAALAREGDHRLHDRREARDRPDAQVVAVREAARDDDALDPAEVRVGVPEEHRLAHALGGELRVDLVARAGEADDSRPQPAAASRIS